MKRKMQIHKIKSNVPASPIIFVLILLLVVIPASGCSFFSTIKKTTKLIARDLHIEGSDLKKMAGIAYFENRTFFTIQNFKESFHKSLTESLTDACHNLILMEPDDSGYPDLLSSQPVQGTGRIDNIALADAGKKLGLNAIVTGALIDISGAEETKGILWFKKTENIVRVMINIEVYDTETAAKLYDKNYVRKIEVEKPELNAIKTKTIKDLPLLNDAFTQVAASMGQDVCEVICAQPWRGYIISTAGNKVVLSTGKKAGLLPDDIFEVYDCEKIIKGTDGHCFVIPGYKTGEIKITTVYQDRAEAVILSGEGIREGSSVSLKNDSEKQF